MESEFCIFTIFVAFLLVILIGVRRTSKSRSNTRNLPPGPWKLPIIGNMHQLVFSPPHLRLTDLAKKYGPIMHLQLGQISTIVISSPELAKETMKTHDLIFSSRPFNLAASVIAYDSRDIVFAPYGQYWRQLRKICTLELLNPKRVRSFQSIREEEVSCLIRSMASNADAPVNLSNMVEALTCSIVSRTTFGKVCSQKEAFNQIIPKIIRVLGGFSMADMFPSIKPLGVLTGMRSKLQKLHKEADAILEEIISEHREGNKFQSIEADDLVSVLLNLQDSGTLGIPLTIQDIKAVILDIFLGGVETSTTVIEWAMSEMVKHPKILEKAQAEVRGVLSGKEKIDLKSMDDLSYLNLVIKETLRFHIPGPFIPRETRESVEICGYKIPAKTQVLINARAIARDPSCWTQPEIFCPERFLNSFLDYKGTNFEFIPFGAGRRICPGMLYGISAVELVLAKLLYHFDWKVPNGGKPEDLDMSETFGLGVRRTNNLCLIPNTFVSF